MTRITVSAQLAIEASSHPSPVVRRAGFDLTHPYLEQCWSAHLGPSAVLLLRRIPVLWQDREPGVVATDELARALGLGRPDGPRSRLNRAIERIVDYRLAEWTDPGRALAVYTELPPLRDHQLARLPATSRLAHGRLLDEHLARLATPTPTRAPELHPSPSTTDLAPRTLSR